MMKATSPSDGLMPIMWGYGTDSQVMNLIGASMVGGLVNAIILTLNEMPAIYGLWKDKRLEKWS